MNNKINLKVCQIAIISTQLNIVNEEKWQLLWHKTNVIRDDPSGNAGQSQLAFWLFWNYIPHFLDYKTHWTIRCTQVLEEENRKKTPIPLLPPPPASQVSYIRTIRCTPIFLPNLVGGGGSASYSLKNMASHFMSTLRVASQYGKDQGAIYYREMKAIWTALFREPTGILCLIKILV